MHAAAELVRRASLDNAQLNDRQLALINHALNKSLARYTVESHRISHGVSYETARSDLLRLTELGLLEQRKSGKAHVFVPAHDLRKRLKEKRKR